MSECPTIQPTQINSIDVIKFKIRQYGTHRPIIYPLRLDIRTPRISTYRVSEGHYVISVPNTSNLIGGGFTAHSPNRMIRVEPYGTQIALHVSENSTPNTTGGMNADNFWGYISLYYKNDRVNIRDPRPLITGFKIKEDAVILGPNELYGDPPTIEEAFANFRTRIGVVNESTVRNYEITNSRYVIKGYGNTLNRGYTIAAFSFQTPSNQIGFKRDGNDIILRYVATTSPDDDQTFYVKDTTLTEVMLFIEFKPKWRRVKWRYRKKKRYHRKFLFF